MSSSRPDIDAIRRALNHNLAQAEAAEQSFTELQQKKDAIRKVLEHNLEQANQDESKMDKEIEIQMAIAEENYRQHKDAWDAHVRKRRVKKLFKLAVAQAISHFTVIGGGVVEAPALIKTDRHIKKLASMTGICVCEGMACKAELRPYIMMQKAKKFDSSTNKLLPLVSTAQTISNVLDPKDQMLEVRAQQLMTACKAGCRFANGMAAELLGGNRAAWAHLEALKRSPFGWRELEEKMAPN